MQDRIDRLEKLVRSAIADKNGSPKSSPGTMAAPEEPHEDSVNHDEPLPTIGVLEIKDHQRSLYSGSTAWNGILHEVSLHKASIASIATQHSFFV